MNNKLGITFASVISLIILIGIIKHFNENSFLMNMLGAIIPVATITACLIYYFKYIRKK